MATTRVHWSFKFQTALVDYFFIKIFISRLGKDKKQMQGKIKESAQRRWGKKNIYIYTRKFVPCINFWSQVNLKVGVENDVASRAGITRIKFTNRSFLREVLSFALFFLFLSQVSRIVLKRFQVRPGSQLFLQCSVIPALRS